jgi:hydrogenase maturation protein HypF
VALALLWELFGKTALGRNDLAPIAAFSPSERSLLGQMLSKGINSPVTTSMGRLFDGVAALLDLQQTVSFEAEAAIALEHVADVHVQDSYPIDFVEQGAQGREQGSRKDAPLLTSDLRPPSSILDWHPLIFAILADLDQNVPIPTIAARFHNALVDAILAVAQHVGEPHVALSGGVFQNRLLVVQTCQRLRENGFEVILHRQVPPNDGGISLGQIAIVAKQFKRHTT